MGRIMSLSAHSPDTRKKQMGDEHLGSHNTPCHRCPPPCGVWGSSTPHMRTRACKRGIPGWHTPPHLCSPACGSGTPLHHRSSESCQHQLTFVSQHVAVRTPGQWCNKTSVIQLTFTPQHVAVVHQESTVQVSRELLAPGLPSCPSMWQWYTYPGRRVGCNTAGPGHPRSQSAGRSASRLGPRNRGVLP